MSSFYHFAYSKLHTDDKKCLVYRGGGKEGQFIRFYYHIQSRPGWDNDCWSNKVIEEQLDQRQMPPSKLEQYCMGCWPGLITDTSLSARTVIKEIPRESLNSSARVAYRAHG